MLQGKKITVVIPTLNEAEGIAKTIGLVPSFVDEIIVVDGNSSDGTREVAEKHGARVILEKRKGYGRAFKTGFENAVGDIIATTDGDGTYPIDMLEQVVAHLVAKQLSFVSCSRFPLQDKTSMRKRNYLGNIMMTKAASTLWLKHFDDILSGMWVFEKSALQRMPLLSDGWNFSEEIKLLAYLSLGNKFGEFRIPYRERLGETKLVPWKVGVENLVYLIAMRSGTLKLLREILGKPNKSTLLGPSNS